MKMTMLDMSKMEWLMQITIFKRIFSKISKSFAETAKERKEKEKTQTKKKSLQK